jgi:hypothetical protein
MSGAPTSLRARALSAVVLGATLIGATLIGAPSLARADEPVAPKPKIHDFIYGSGIALLMNRVSVGYDWIPHSHHAIGINGFGMLLGITHGGPNVAKGTVFGAGGEIGYRYYVGDDGPSGPFFAISLVGGYYHSRADLYEPDPNARWYIHYGAAIDMGWSFHLDKTTMVAFAVGAQRTWTDERGNLCPLAALLVGDGVRPRFEILVGKVF